MFQCKWCSNEYRSYNGLAKHTSRTHKIKSIDLCITYFYDGIRPTCECDCGSLTSFRSGEHKFQRFVNGHNSRGEGNPMYGRNHTDAAKGQQSKTRKAKFASGELTIDNEKWSKIQKKVWERAGYKEQMAECREQSDWKKKLSNAMSGENHPFYGKKRPEHSKLMSSPKMIKLLFNARSDTDIERLVAQELDKLNISYKQQFFLTSNGKTYSYDFKIKGNPILIEVDGDYWHGGPGCEKHFYMVDEVKRNDVVKDEAAKEAGYRLIRIWGSQVKSSVSEAIKSHILCYLY